MLIKAILLRNGFFLGLSAFLPIMRKVGLLDVLLLVKFVICNDVNDMNEVTKSIFAYSVMK